MRTEKAWIFLWGFHEQLIFATHERVPAKEIFEVLREHNIFVRYFSKPRISNYLRISIGTQQEMERLTAFLAVFLGE